MDVDFLNVYHNQRSGFYCGRGGVFSLPLPSQALFWAADDYYFQLMRFIRNMRLAVQAAARG